MRKLKIVMVGACPYPFPQGSQVFLHGTASALLRIGHSVRLVVYDHGAGDTPPSDVALCRAKRWPLARDITASGPDRTKPLHDAALLAALRRTLRSEGADIVCAHNYEALLVALAARTRPVVYMAHNALADELPYYFDRPGAESAARRAGRWFDNTFPRRADRIIAPHRRLAGYLVLRGCPQDRVEIIPPPVDADAFPETMPAEVPMPPIVYTGNLDKYQNLGLLLDAVAIIRRSRPAVRLVMATAALPPFPNVEHVPCDTLGALRAVLSQDVVVAVPRVSWSGYPIKLLNAMAAGRPVAACAGAAWPLKDGENGLVVPDNDANALAAALVRLMDQPRLRRDLGRAARATVLGEHHPETVARRLETVFLEALGVPPRTEAESPLGNDGAAP